MDFIGGSVKFKLVYIYPVLIILIVVVLLFTTTKKDKPVTAIKNDIANQEMPNDEVHKGLNNPGINPPNKQNVNSSVFEQLEKLRSEVEKNPNDTLKLREYADFLAAAHKLDEAIIYYIKILKIDPNKKEILFTLSFIYNMKGDFNKAENFTNKILRIDPKDTQAWYNLGAINASKGNKNKAREIWEQILKEYPGSPSANLAKSALTKL
jgi:tetratricopeptide (TPR) repeat protein